MATATSSLSFVVMPENDPPVLQLNSASYDSSRTSHDGLSFVIESVEAMRVAEDQYKPIPGISVRDIDLDFGDDHIFGGDPDYTDGLIEVAIFANNGTVSLEAGATGCMFLIGDGEDDMVVAFRSSLADANRALVGLHYRGRPDYYGTDELLVTVDDRGNCGRGSLCAPSIAYGSDASGKYGPCSQVLD